MSLSPELKPCTVLPRVNLGSTASQEDCQRAMADLEKWPLLHSNWDTKPQDVNVTFSLAYGSDAFFLTYEVDEPVIRAACQGDSAPVCQDSCVEWFVSVKEGKYMNFEFNPIGAVTIMSGTERHGRQLFSFDDLQGLKIWTSEGNSPFDRRVSQSPWEIWVVIPYKILGVTLAELKQSGFKSNFYKCGDLLPAPHYLSWQPIDWPTPDFHRPEFFVEMPLLD
jgi:hypothetical protein